MRSVLSSVITAFGLCSVLLDSAFRTKACWSSVCDLLLFSSSAPTCVLIAYFNGKSHDFCGCGYD